MVISLIEQLLTKIQQLQLIMIAVSTDAYRNPIREKEKSYTELYKEIVDLMEFIEEEGFLIENTNPFKSLSNWRDCWSSLESGYASKGGYIHNLYEPIFNEIDIILCKDYLKDKSHQELVDEWQIPRFEELKQKIKHLKMTLISVASEREPIPIITYEEEAYKNIYREATLQINILREIGILALNPNKFRSLWQWYNYWKSQLAMSSTVREQYINQLYESLLEPIEKALNKYKYRTKSTTTEEFIQDLQHRFNKQIFGQPTTTIVTIPSNTVQVPNRKLEGSLQDQLLKSTVNSSPIASNNSDNCLPVIANDTSTWKNEHVMNTEVFLDQNDIIYLENSLENLFAIQCDNAASRRSIFTTSGVDTSFARNLNFNSTPVEFTNIVVAKFQDYKLSSQRVDYHPMVNLLQYLLKRKESYELSDQDVDIFTKLAERGQENFNAIRASNTVCRIESPKGTGIGTGVLVGKNLLLTCNHIFSKTQVKQAWVRFNYKVNTHHIDKDLFELDMTLVSYHNHPDYALVKIKGNSLQTNTTCINENSLLDEGEEIRIIHHPQGNPVVISDLGQIMQVGEEYIDHNLKTDEGSSGAPIFNSRWELIAIHQGKVGIGRNFEPGTTGGIPIRAIWNQLLPHLS